MNAWQQQTLDNAKKVLEQVRSTQAVAPGEKALKDGRIKFVFKNSTKDGGKTGTITATYHGLSGYDVVATVTYGTGQSEYSNVNGAFQDAKRKAIAKLERQIAQWEKIGNK